MQKIIYVNKYLSSAEYFNNILSEVQSILRYYDIINEVVFDFSGTTRVEPNVIPNLLCLGKVIQSVMGRKAIIRIPDTFEGGKLKNYFYQIKFTQYAKNEFEFESDPYTGFDGKIIDPVCRTVFFPDKILRDEIEYKFDQLVGPFAYKYLAKYNTSPQGGGPDENSILNFLKELAVNSCEHGLSYSYTTIHAKYSNRTIYIAISDGGRGFLESCVEEHAEDIYHYKKVIDSEACAILYCINVRKKSKIFGLHSVIRDTISVGGTVRIHSNDSQVIFTPRIKEQFEKDILLDDLSFWKYNVKKDLRFGGTHIEIEIPF